MVDNAAVIGVDPGRVAVGGDSAGGNLAAVVAQQAQAAGRPGLCYQLLVYPVTDYNLDTGSYRENAEGYLLTRPMMAWFWNHYLCSEADGRNPKASPLRAEDLRGLPSALVITAGYDPLRDEGEAYARRLQAAGVQVQLRQYPDVIHGFFTLTAAVDQGKAAVSDAAAQLRAAFAR